MNIKSIVAAVVVSAFGSISAAQADELLLTAESSKSGQVTMIGVDVASDGSARGIQARIAVPKGSVADTTKCLSNLPTGFQGVCEFNGGEVRLMVFAFDQRTLPTGLVELGTIKVTGQLQGQAALVVADFQVVDGSGTALPSKSTVSFDRADSQPPAARRTR